MMAPPSDGQPVTLRSTMDASSGKSNQFRAGTTLRQSFLSRADARPSELGVRMGANQLPYGVHLRLWVRDQLVFEHDYANCAQRRSDWATVFDISAVGVDVHRGDDVVFELTPSINIGIEPLQLTDPELSPGVLEGSGTIYARYYMAGVAVPPMPEQPVGVSFEVTSDVERPAAGAVTICTLFVRVPTNQNLAVGQRVAISFTPGANTETVSTHWEISGNPIGGYDSRNGPDERYGRVIPLQLNERPVEPLIWFYWTQPGDYTVTLRVTANVLRPPCDNPGPQTVQATGVFHVLGPRIRSSVLKTSDVYRTEREVAPGHFWPALRLGSAMVADEDDIGCLMRATVYTPPLVGTGELRGVQLTRYESRADDYIEVHSTGNDELLDGVEQYNDERVLSNEGFSVIQLDDNPVQAVNPAFDHLQVDEHFRMFIQWRSSDPGSLWVTLGIFEWFWRAGLLKAQDGSWAVVAAETDYSAQLLPFHRDFRLIAGHELPEWSGVCPRDEHVITAPGYQIRGVPPVSVKTPFVPQAGRRQLWVSMWVRGFGMDPGRVLTQEETERELGERVVARRQADGTVKYCTWMVPNLPSGPVPVLPGPVFVNWHLHTAQDAMPEMDLSVRRGLSSFVFGLQVAPFCFGDLAYWKERARVPITIDGEGEVDQSFAAYTNRLMPLLPPGTRQQMAGDGNLRLTFTSAPPMELLQRIAAMPQTHRLRRFTDEMIIDPTDGEELG